MDLFFADDAIQRSPTRPGAGQLIATGGLCIPSALVGPIERVLDQLCHGIGFPPGEEFKWSPRRNSWMYDNLLGNRRLAFFANVLSIAQSVGAVAIVVIEDKRYGTATDAASHEEDATRLLLERIHMNLAMKDKDGIVVTDRPGGGRGEEDRFLAQCLETIQAGTTYIKPERIALNVLSTPSHLVRWLQVADVITSCTLAYFSGEAQYSPGVFARLKGLFASEKNRIGGVGLKMHPDTIYANLYHWLLGDDHFIKLGVGVPFPLKGRPYADGPDSF